MSQRTLHSWIGTIILIGLLTLGFGLDWEAMLWAPLFGDPPVPADNVHHWETVDEGNE